MPHVAACRAGVASLLNTPHLGLLLLGGNWPVRADSEVARPLPSLGLSPGEHACRVPRHDLLVGHLRTVHREPTVCVVAELRLTFCRQVTGHLNLSIPSREPPLHPQLDAALNDASADTARTRRASLTCCTSHLNLGRGPPLIDQFA